MVLMAARRLAGIGNRILAEWMRGKDDSAVTQAVKRLEARIEGSRGLAKFYESLRRHLGSVSPKTGLVDFVSFCLQSVGPRRRGEMADTSDLKSEGVKTPCGFESRRRHATLQKKPAGRAAGFLVKLVRLIRRRAALCSGRTS